MNQSLIRFPSIGQFHNAIRDIKSLKIDKPLSFTGTVKLHGTNAAIVMNKGDLYYQSRERILTPENDNYDFASYMTGIDPRSFAKTFLSDGTKTAIYGEWCGGDIQTKVAISNLPKMFVAFAAWRNGEWLDLKQYDHAFKDTPFYSIHQFPTWKLDIDFSRPKLVQNELVSITKAVEAECPVAKSFGVSGVGEGVVWTCDSHLDIRFKVKGKDHSSSHVSVLASTDTENYQNIYDFVDSVVSENRLEQGLQVMTREMQLDITKANTSAFVRWVITDVMKEEAQAINDNNIALGDLNKEIAHKARVWFCERVAS